MITRKENLLIRPFQRRKYVEHRQKVITALPRIDDVTPTKRNHVYIKCKKLQTEAERQAQIKRDNFILLKHLNDIMKMKRVDDYWLYEHPKFLRRIKLFHQHSLYESFENDPESIEFPKSASKKERCIAGHPENYLRKEIIPEERVPWEMKPIREFHSTDTSKRLKKRGFPRIRNELFFDYEHFKNDKISNTAIPSPFAYAKKPRGATAPPLRRTHEFAGEKISKEKPRGATAPPLRRTHKLIGEKISNEKPLTVVIRFPPKAQVTLHAGID